MGMYTEILIRASLRSDISAQDMATLEYLFGEDRPDKLVSPPDHQFFKLPRWRSIGSGSSYSHLPWSTSQLRDDDRGGLYLFSRSDLKNYDGEIGAFFDWFDPLIDTMGGECIGWSWNEEDDVPTLVLKETG